MEKCKCELFSCHSLTDKVGDDYIISTNRRFQFIKENNIIVDGGVVPNDIPTCRKSGEFKPLKK